MKVSYQKQIVHHHFCRKNLGQGGVVMVWCTVKTFLSYSLIKQISVAFLVLYEHM